MLLRSKDIKGDQQPDMSALICRWGEIWVIGNEFDGNCGRGATQPEAVPAVLVGIIAILQTYLRVEEAKSKQSLPSSFLCDPFLEPCPLQRPSL